MEQKYIYKHPIYSILKDPGYPIMETATAFAPTNIALIKYWGKRNSFYNLPFTSSISISLRNKGTLTTISLSNDGKDKYYLDKKFMHKEHPFSQRIFKFLNGIRPKKLGFIIHTQNNFPSNVGLASSASGFCALVLALNKLFNWKMSYIDLSRLSRIGSGSACRSLWNGFVKWQSGKDFQGKDSYGIQLNISWKEFRIGIPFINKKKKIISSRIGMNHTVKTSKDFFLWIKYTKKYLRIFEKSLYEKNFQNIGYITESHSLYMHTIIENSIPPIYYRTIETLKIQKKVYNLRKNGISVFFTQDAGPNIILIFLNDIEKIIQKKFPGINIINPF